MKTKRWYILIFTLIVVLVIWFGFSLIVNRQKTSVEHPNLSPAIPTMVSYTNAQGRTWSIPTGEDKFTVASKENYPRFVSGDINPVKISIGQTQKMSVVVRDNVPLKKVWAEIENDKSTDTVPLVMVSSSAVSFNTIENQKYFVDESGTLVVSDENKKSDTITNLIQSLAKKVEAEQAVDYFYEGSWVAHDTRTITYHTTFYAEDTLGRTDKLVLAWSDPCPVDSSGYLTGNCNLTYTWGVDGLNFTVTSNNTINLTGSANLVHNNGKSIFIQNGGKITLQAGTTISRGNLYFIDYDTDGYTPTTTMYTSCPTSHCVAVAYVSKIAGDSLDPQIPSSNSLDCNDYNSLVFPSEDKYYNSKIAEDSFDYNCSGVDENPGYSTFNVSKGPFYNQLYICQYGGGNSWYGCYLVSGLPTACGSSSTAAVGNCQSSSLQLDQYYGYFSDNAGSNCIGNVVYVDCR